MTVISETLYAKHDDQDIQDTTADYTICNHGECGQGNVAELARHSYMCLLDNPI